VITCAEDRNNTSDNGEASIFLTVPASQVVCQQSLMNDTFTAFNDGTIYVAGFAGVPSVALTEYSRYARSTDPSARRVFSSAWDEVGTTDTPGELWWGRRGSTGSAEHIAVGQLAWKRQLYQSFRASNADVALRITRAEISPFSSTLEMTYDQIGSTITTYRQGLGGVRGRLPILPGAVSAASLTLNPAKPISGSLTMNIEVDGHIVTRVLPLRANVKESDPSAAFRPDNVWALRAAPSVTGENCDDVACLFPAESPTSGRRGYSANVQFFGSNAQFAVVRYSIGVDSPPEKITTDNIGQGIVVLKLRN
jgi:hypothetical protein